MRRSLPAALILLASAGAGGAAPCGGSFAEFVAGLKAEAVQRGHSSVAAERFLAGARQDPEVLRRDRAQGFFTLPFTEFARRLVSENRLAMGRRNAERHAATLAEAERRFGVPPGILLAFWALETDFGAVQGDINTRDALVTLAHDCRRPQLFRPQVFAALALHEKGDFDPATTTGAWAGEIGQVQMLPRDILELGVDGDGDGHVRLKESAADALLSGANMLRSLGWRAGEPWLQEVRVPGAMDWGKAGIASRLPVAEWERMGVAPLGGGWLGPGLQASLVLPEGRLGPAFLAYPNFSVLFEWNQSFTYVLTAAYLATRYAGAAVFDARSPEPGLHRDAMKALQRKLAARGHDVGAIDGILGAGTRAAVRAEQQRLGLPADAWPTQALLERL